MIGFYYIRDLLRLRKAVMMAEEAHAKNGERYYVMPTADGKVMVTDRKNFRIMKRKGYVSDKATVPDLARECFYCTPYRNGKEELPPDVVALKRRQYLSWAGACRSMRKKDARQGRRSAFRRLAGWLRLPPAP